ncbi:glycosyltransferase family 2 protein [Acetomicrobium sp.]|uniref:glycosyltransferase family 2 protein n=1 Tax=Acetomicrobium sp. TaxID=1872099 RepID=UPI001BCAF7FB|nr:glycosyltransferase family 2 protein [Acetomicrobium sp.]
MSGLLSLIIPVYNGTRYLQGTLDSLENQNYEPIELILVDDGSTDDTLSIIRSFAEKSRYAVKVISQANAGVSAARNRGFSEADGKYVAFCDQDDLFDPCCFLKLIDEMERHGSEMAFCGHDFIDEEGKPIGRYDDKHSYPKANPAKGIDVLYDYLVGKVSIWGGAVLYRKDFLLAKGIRYTPNCICAEDNEFFIKALATAESVACVKESLAFWRQHPGSTSHSFQALKIEANLHELTAYLRCKAFMEKRGKTDTKAYKTLTSLVIPSAYIAYLQKVVLVYGKERFKAMALAESLRSKLADSSNLMLFIKRTDLYFKLFLAMYFQDAFANLTRKRYEKKTRARRVRD